jgi:hypothetical protein
LRPKAVIHHNERIAMKQPFAAGDKLPFMKNRPFRLSIVLAVAGAILAPAMGAAVDVPPHDNDPRSAFDPANYAGGDGLSKANAVILKISSDTGGIASEYAWVSYAYPGSKVVQQALTTWDHGKRYDVLTVEAANHSVELWFDITLMYK